MSEINLVASKRRKSASAERNLQIVRIGANVSLIVVVLLSLLFFFLNRNSSLPSIQQQEKTALASLTFLHPKIAQYLILKERLQSISTILTTRTSFETTLGQVTAILPPSVTVTALSIDQKSVSFNLNSTSLVDLQTFLDALIARVNSKKLFKKLTIENIIADEKSGQYTVLVDAVPL